jgi:hypothetical protein
MELKKTTLTRLITLLKLLGFILLLDWLIPTSKNIIGYAMYVMISLSFLYEIWKRKLYVPFFIGVDTWYKKVIVVVDKYSSGFFLGSCAISLKMPVLGSALGLIFATFMLFRFLKYGNKHGRLK